MKVFGIAGRSGMGKTTLLERLIPALVARGLRVSILKHSHKDIEVDRPGKDSHRLREAGCQEVLLLGRTRWALMHELRDEAEPTLAELLPRIQGCDLLLVEGFKSGDFPKLEVWRAAVGTGVLGGFTTYSAFAVQTSELATDRPAMALGYALATVVGGWALALLGIVVGRRTRR